MGKPYSTNYEGRMDDMTKELLPFRDVQDAAVYGRCPVCGRELYSERDVCGYCQRFFP